MEDKKAKVQGAKEIEDAVTAGQKSMEKTAQAGQETVEKAAKVGKENAEKTAKVAKAGQETVEKATKAEQETVEKAAKAGKENAEKAAKAGTDALSSGYDRCLALAREQLERVLPEAGGKFDDFANFSKGTAGAFFKAGDVVAKALESIGDDVVAYNRKVWDDSIANTKALLGCKTFEDIVELQTTVARAQFEKFVSDSAKLGELSLKTVNQALEPIGASVNEAIDRFGKPIAA